MVVHAVRSADVVGVVWGMQRVLCTNRGLGGVGVKMQEVVS